MRLLISLSTTAELKRLLLEVIGLFTKDGINCDRKDEFNLVVHTALPAVNVALTKAGWTHNADYNEWANKSNYVLVTKGGGSATQIEFIYND